MNTQTQAASSIQFVFPLNGDCVNVRDGVPTETGIQIPVTVTAPAGSDIYINGQKALEADGFFRAGLAIDGYRTVLTAENRVTGETSHIAVYYFPEAIGKFRLSSDDNLLFLKDITEHQDVYRSIFDNPYLAVYKKAHDLYGTKVHLNLFYELDDEAASRFNPRPSYFNLSMMTDRFKEEFKANSDWLKLAFHANSELPDKPYEFDEPEKIRKDCLAVNREILRFAGPDRINDTTTTHWGSANRACVRELRSLGYRSLTGYFQTDSHGVPLVSYYKTAEQIAHIGERDFFFDTEEDMLFGQIDLVLNMRTYERMMEKLAGIVEHPHRGGFVSIMIHEQYFYPNYANYLPDFEHRVLSACRYLHEHGYVGAHICDVTQEKHLRDNPLLRATKA